VSKVFFSLFPIRKAPH